MEKEIILTLDGGGSFGTWHFGVARALKEKNYKIKKISSASVGSLAALAIKANSVDKGIEIFSSIDGIRDLVYFKDVLLAPWRVYRHGSLFPQDRILDYIKQIFTEKVFEETRDLEMVVTAVSYNTGKLCDFSSSELNYETFLKAVLASAAIPGAFLPVRIGSEEFFFDASTREDIPMECLYRRSPEVKSMDHLVCVCQPKEALPRTGSGQFLDVWLRGHEVSSREVSDDDLRIGKMLHWGDNVKVIRNETLFMKSTLDYSKESLRKLLRAGYEEALQSL
jgi:predicted acylesterase/phospholipase RssA